MTVDVSDRASSNVPPRFRIPRRVVAVGNILLLLIIVRLIWGAYESVQLEREVKRLRERGQPLAAEDFTYVPLADDQNAATFLMDAAKAFNPNATPPRASNNIYPPYPPYDAKWMADAGASEAAHGKLFQLAREARSRPKAQWRDQPFTAPLTIANLGMNNLNAARNLANILGDGAEYQHLTGNDAEALDRARDLLHLSGSLRQDDPMISQLVATGIDAMAANAILQIAPGLRLDRSTNPAARASAQAVLADLLNEAPLRDGVRRSLVFEQAAMHEFRTGAGSGTWVVRPLVDAQLVWDHRNLEILIHAASDARNKPQFVAAMARATVEQPRETGPRSAALAVGYRHTPRYSRWFATDANYDRYLETTFRVLGERRMTAVSLAAQLFRADHQRWPKTLDELVPAYLPSAPLDPFADGKPIGYILQRGTLPGGGDRPVVYVRTGERDMGPYPEPIYSWEHNRWPTLPRGTEVWQYRDLERFNPPQPAASQPSTQAVDNEP
jgi:hypothetical protein